MAEDEGRSYKGSPARDITSSVSVGIGSVATTDAFELRLIDAVSLIDTTAYWACPRRVSGVYRTHSNPSQLCLVLNKAAQLVERPTVQTVKSAQGSTLTVPNRGSVSDTAKFL